MRVLNKRHGVSSSNTVYIGRGRGRSHMCTPGIKPGEPGWLGNPIVIGQPCRVCGKTHHGGGKTLECYKLELLHKLATDEAFKKAVIRLRESNKDLVCWCVHSPWSTEQFNGYDGLVCHGQLLAVIMQEI